MGGIKATTKDNPEYQEFEDWRIFMGANKVRHSYNDKPSEIGYDDNGKVYYEAWHLDGKCHRSNNKPSVIGYDSSGKISYERWYLDSMEYTEQEYKQIMKQIKAMNDTEKLLDSRWWVREMACLK